MGGWTYVWESMVYVMADMKMIMILTVILCANIVETITGFAGTLLAMPALMLLMGVNHAKVAVNMISIFVGIGILVRSRKHVNQKQVVRIVLFMAVGIVLGIRIYLYLPVGLLLKVYGIMIIGVALKKTICPETGKSDKKMDNVVLILAGIVHGIFVSGGALLVIYAGRVLKDKQEFRATLASVWIILNSAIALQQIAAGSYTEDIVKIIALSVIPLIIANYIGNKIHGKISQEVFMKITYILLILSGVSILV